MKTHHIAVGAMLAAFLILMLASCLPAGTPPPVLAEVPAPVVNQTTNPAITRYIDAEAGVVCWVYAYETRTGEYATYHTPAYSLSCLPLKDTELGQ